MATLTACRRVGRSIAKTAILGVRMDVSGGIGREGLTEGNQGFLAMTMKLKPSS